MDGEESILVLSLMLADAKTEALQVLITSDSNGMTTTAACSFANRICLRKVQFTFKISPLGDYRKAML